ncbi:MAG TPA: hypothetical protein VJ810_25755 [Blastocatellia bacterium]|nr:hypothetical protein [Blastocatellia bacterium]
MFKQSRLFTLCLLSLSLIGVMKSAYAQNNKQGASIEIRSVVKNEAQAKKSPDGKSRLAPVIFQFVCNGTDAGKVSDLEAVLETVFNDGSRSRVIKGIKDGTSNTLLERQIEISIPDGLSASEFTLTLRGKWRVGNEAKQVDVSAVKKGRFPGTASFVERKK